MTETASTWTDCPDCGETLSVPPFIDRPANIRNGTALTLACKVAICSACQAVVYGQMPDQA